MFIATAPSTLERVVLPLLELPQLVFVLGVIIVTVSVITGTVKKIAVTREREQTRRDIAAYLAQGMLTQEQAAMLLEKGQRPSGSRPSC